MLDVRRDCGRAGRLTGRQRARRHGHRVTTAIGHHAVRSAVRLRLLIDRSTHGCASADWPGAAPAAVQPVIPSVVRRCSNVARSQQQNSFSTWPALIFHRGECLRPEGRIARLQP